MSERIRIDRSEDHGRAPGWWKQANGEPMLRCPYCNTSASLADHEIDASGNVEPSVECPTVSCEFHAWVTLEGWRRA